MTETLRILWMNWRDIRHPLAGGAEVYTHEVAKRLAARGHEVVLVTSRPQGLPPEETIDGYRVIRRGGRLTVYPAARRVYHELRRKGWRPDIVIDEINTVPFMTPLYVEEPIAVLIHQLCRDCWSQVIGPLLQPLAWHLFEKQLHRPYIHAARDGKLHAVITVSEETRKDLTELGYPRDRITIAYNGLPEDLHQRCPRAEKKDLVVYIGRIASYKRLHELVEAWKLVELNHPTAQLIIAGRADPRYLRKLLEKAASLGLQRASFYTNISEEEKLRLLAEAKIMVYTSTREGWGRGVYEAAACHTPTIAYNVPGLREAVKPGETGLLVEPGDTQQLADRILGLLSEERRRTLLASRAREIALLYTWSNTVDVIESLLLNTASGRVAASNQARYIIPR